MNQKVLLICVKSWEKSKIGSMGAAMEAAAAKVEAQQTSK
jgi:hypothetical protein